MIRALLAALVLMVLVPLSYGAQQTINVGSAANDGTGDTGRAAFQKVNANDTELYTIGPAHYVACTNGATGAADVALLAPAMALGGPIVLTANCTINAPLTMISNTLFNGNGYTITAAAASFWSGSVVRHAFTSDNTSYITIENTTFDWSATTSQSIHIIDFAVGNSKIQILNNTATGAGDFVAFIGSTDVTEIGNRAYMCTNACFDHWNGAGYIKVIGNTASTTTAAVSSNGILVTGFNTNNSAGTQMPFFIIADNNILLNGQAVAGQLGVWLEGYASTYAGYLTEEGSVHDNTCTVATGVWAQCVRGTGFINNITVHNNLIWSDGVTTSNLPAIEINGGGPTNIWIHDNHANNWKGQTAGSDRGVFTNKGTGGSLNSNTCTGTCTSPLEFVNTSTTIQQYGSGTGTATNTFTSASDFLVAPTVNSLTMPYNLYQWGVPAIVPSSGDFNAGVVTLSGAISNANACTSTTGCYMYFPSGAICATCISGGVSPAGAYFCQNSGVSTTVFNCFNNVLSSGVPVTIASPTAFVSPGDPAGYTQTTASLIPLVTLSIPGGTMGANGSLYIKTLGQRPNNANTVIQEWSFGGTNFAIASTVSVNWYGMERTLQNVGAQNAQLSMAVVTGGTDMNFNTNNSAFIGISSGSNQNLVLNCQINTATDWCEIFAGKVQVD